MLPGLREGGPGVPSLEPVASDVRAAARMRRLSLAWLLGGVILLAASVSCNRTFQGEDFAPGGLRRRRNALGSWWKRARRALLRAPLDSLSGFDRRTNQLGHPGSVPQGRTRDNHDPGTSNFYLSVWFGEARKERLRLWGALKIQPPFPRVVSLLTLSH